MQRLSVESSDLVSVGYDPRERILEVEFQGGRVYQYFDVPADIYQGMMRAKSLGQFFSTYIINYFRYRRISEAEQADPIANQCQVALITGNTRKFREAVAGCALFGIRVEQLDLTVNEIQHHDPLEITRRKAADAYAQAKRPVVVNDVSWRIPALNGFPGGYMKDIQQWLTAEDFIRLMAGKTDRRICAIEIVIYKDAQQTKLFSKEIWGVINTTPRGRGDPLQQIVSLEEGQPTLAENHQQGQPSIAHEDYIWHDFAKWFAAKQDH